MKSKVIVNPKAASSKTAKAWPDIEKHLKNVIGEFETVFTEKHNHATELSRNALKEGFERIIAVGGDGTWSEAVNGFFDNGEPVNKEAIFSVVASGSNCDFKKSLDMSDDMCEAIRCMATAEPREIDVGKITFLDGQNKMESRYFINDSGIGLTNETRARYNKSRILKRFLPGSISGVGFGIYSLAAYKNKNVRIVIDDGDPIEQKVLMVMIFNGRITGDMQIAPTAELDDGMLDISIFGDLGKMETLKMIPKMFSGEYINESGITAVKAKKIELFSDENIGTDIDGDTYGKLPVICEVVPKALKFCY